MEAQALTTENPMDDLLAALRAAAEPTRLRILALASQGELTVSELVHILGQSQPRISRHLKLLTEAGLVTRHREGSWVFHRLADDGPGAEVARQLMGLLPRIDSRDGILNHDRSRHTDVRFARERHAEDYFNGIAGHWDKLRSLHVDDAKVEKAIGKMLPENGIENLLDLGTGTGRILEVLSTRTRRAVGIDQSHEMLNVARANLDKANCDNCQVRQGDLYQLPFPETAFDAATIHQVLHFLDDPARAIKEAARVLAPGGRLVVIDFLPHREESLRDEHNHRHLGFPDKDILSWFAKAGLKSVDQDYLTGTPLTVALWLAEKPPMDS